MDIKAAFLQGKPIERNVYLKPPKEAYAASIVTGSIKDARVRDFIVANKFIKFLNSRGVVLPFPTIDDLRSSSLISFSDISFANLKCGGSQDSLIIFSEGSNDKYIPLTWQASCEKYFDSRDTSLAVGYIVINNDQIYVFRNFENTAKQ